MAVPPFSGTAVRQYLYTQLTASLAPDPLDKTAQLLVCYDTPGPYEPEDIVAVGKVESQIEFSSMVGGGGPGWLQENYSVTVTIDVFRGGDDPQAAYSRAAVLANAVCAVVRSDPSLGGLVIVARPSRYSAEVDWDDEHRGRHCTAELTIDCLNRI